MKKWILIVMVGIASEAFSQQAEPVLFKEKTFDFGEIMEQGGNVEHEFIFTNNTGRSLKVISVQASCGCTTPGWTREAIANGKSGFIKASFDPRGRPGYFNKSLTVTTDFDGVPIVLQIKGQVSSGDSVLSDWPAKQGNLMLKTNSFNLGRVFINREPTPKEFAVRNGSGKDLHFMKVIAPPYLLAEFPMLLKPGEAGVIKVTYDVRQKKQYGFASDNIAIETDDLEVPLKSFSVYTTLEEFFPALSAEELAKAPVLKISQMTLDFGRLNQGTDGLQEVILKNEGKKELNIRSLQPNCSCVTAQAETLTIKGGGEAKLKILLSTQGRSGTQQKALTIYSNDPTNPVQRIVLSAYIR